MERLSGGGGGGGGGAVYYEGDFLNMNIRLFFSWRRFLFPIMLPISWR